MAAGFLYVGIQLIAAVLPWLVAIGGMALVVLLLLSLIRWRRQHW